jgi:DNA-directed RNA polymerase subunit L
MEQPNSEFILLKTQDEKISVDVRMKDDTVCNLLKTIPRVWSICLRCMKKCW